VHEMPMLPYSLPVHYTCRNKQMPLDIIKFLLFHQPNLAHKVDMEGRLQLQLNLHVKMPIWNSSSYALTRLHARSLEQQDKFVRLRLAALRVWKKTW
jgi:hypothetical protein